jgi:hypothetical protein
MEWHHLKCRAETLYDVCQFIVWVNKRNYNYEDIDIRLVYSRIEPLGSSECTWEFESNLEPWDIRRLMREAEREDNSDFHIMRQTLQYMERKMSGKKRKHRSITMKVTKKNQSRYSK